MAVEHNTSLVLHASYEGRDFCVRTIGAEYEPAIDAIRWQDYHRRFVEPGYVSQEGVAEYVSHLKGGSGSFAPKDMQTIGLFLAGKTYEGDLVGFQRWGASTYPPHRDTTAMLEKYAKEGKNNEIPAYTESRCTAVVGHGYGTILRYVSALSMQQAGYVVAGRKIFAFERTNHSHELEALAPANIHRDNAAASGFLAKEVLVPVEVIARSEVYVGLEEKLLPYLVGRHPDLSNFQIKD